MIDLFGEEITTEKKGAKSVFSCIGATSHAKEDRQVNDYYATEPRAVQELLDIEKFSSTILEPCVGEGHIAKVLTNNGYKVLAADIVDRGYENTKIQDFLALKENTHDIITNPPYVLCKEFAEHSLDISPDGVKVAMFLKLTFLESQSRKALFEKYPSSAVAYGWFVWEKGFKGNPIIKWI